MAKSADYKLGDYPFPRGWFAVAQSTQVAQKPFNVHYFGQDMVLYRGKSGKVVMLDAYCPHMGTHLGKNETSATVISERFLEGDCIRCPFHGWRFGPDGKCNHIPYFDGPIPERARLRSWPVLERYNIVFCWHDPEEQAPDFDLPAFPEWDDPQWVRWQGLDYLGDLAHPVEIVDNTSDVAHLEHLHGGKVMCYENEVQGSLLHQRQSMAATWKDELKERVGPTYTALTTYYGPGMLVGRFLEANAIQLICHTPIEDGQARLWQTSMLQSRSNSVDETAKTDRENFNRTVMGGLLRDAEVWRNKKPALQIMQLPSDGPFWQSRVWYSQFYNPRDRAASILKRVAGKHFAKGMPGMPKAEHAKENA